MSTTNLPSKHIITILSIIYGQTLALDKPLPKRFTLASFPAIAKTPPLGDAKLIQRVLWDMVKNRYLTVVDIDDNPVKPTRGTEMVKLTYRIGNVGQVWLDFRKAQDNAARLSELEKIEENKRKEQDKAERKRKAQEARANASRFFAATVYYRNAQGKLSVILSESGLPLSLVTAGSPKGLESAVNGVIRLHDKSGKFTAESWVYGGGNELPHYTIVIDSRTKTQRVTGSPVASETSIHLSENLNRTV